MAKSKRSDGVTLWWVYLVRCGTGRIYTGISPDPWARLEVHRRKTSANMRMNNPLALIGAMPVGGYKDAVQLERRIKRLPPSIKEEIAAHSRGDKP